MSKFTCELSGLEFAGLEDLARREERSKVEVLRRALNLYWKVREELGNPVNTRCRLIVCEGISEEGNPLPPVKEIWLL